LFSYQRASDEGSDTRSWFAPVSDVVVVDDYTVDIMTSAPNPIFPSSIANWMIMDSDWAAANDASLPDKENGNYATLNTNGTGAFVVTAREPGLRTVLEPHGGWWGEAEHNITRAELTPIQNPATALAALLTGDVDFINPVPIQDVARLAENPDVDVIQGIEARVIMGHGREPFCRCARASGGGPCGQCASNLANNHAWKRGRGQPAGQPGHERLLDRACRTSSL